jgi:hypothetical protein
MIPDTQRGRILHMIVVALHRVNPAGRLHFAVFFIVFARKRQWIGATNAPGPACKSINVTTNPSSVQFADTAIVCRHACSATPTGRIGTDGALSTVTGVARGGGLVTRSLALD